jgi:hypothetical protein
MKYIRNGLLALIGIYITTLGFIYIDIEDSRPIISLFKNLQSDSSLEVVDFSVDKEQIKIQSPLQIKIEMHIMVTFMFILNIHLMPMFLVLQPLQMMHIDMQKERVLSIL